MARNEVHPDGNDLSLPVPANTPSGAPVLVGGIKGITQTARGEGGNVAGNASVRTRGTHRVSVTGTINTVGQPVYITSANALTATATDNTLWGNALELKGAGAGTIIVRIARA